MDISNLTKEELQAIKTQVEGRLQKLADGESGGGASAAASGAGTGGGSAPTPPVPPASSGGVRTVERTALIDGQELEDIIGGKVNFTDGPSRGRKI